MKDLDIRRAFKPSIEIGCSEAQDLMSAFIDSMATPREVGQVEAHVFGCDPCRRQLQGYVSVKNLLRSVEAPEVPGDLALKTRVRLSRERNGPLPRWKISLENAARPIAVPALAGLSLAVLFFGLLLSDLAMPTVIASDAAPRTTPALYNRVRTTDPTLTRFAGAGPLLKEPLTVETHVDGRGRVIHYVILGGPDDPEVERWLRDLLFFAEFRPATLFGRPVNSRIILSFVGAS